MSSRADILLLVGPKGVGKTTIGRALEQEAGVYFLEVEEIARRVLAAMGGVIDEAYARRTFDEVVSAVESISSGHRAIVIETTGASEETPRLIEGLRRLHRVRLIRVHADADVCSKRIAERDSTRQVDVPPELIRKMQALSEALELPWDLELDNDPPLAAEEVRRAVSPLLTP
jgi:shikimate kinase